MKKIFLLLLWFILSAGMVVHAQTVDPSLSEIPGDGSAQSVLSEPVTEPVPTQIIMTQLCFRTQFVDKTVFPEITLKTPKYSWLVPGLPQLLTDQKLKGSILGISFLATAVGSLTAYISADTAYSKSVSKWDEALRTSNYSNRQMIIRESDDLFVRSRELLTTSQILLGAAVGISVYSIFDHSYTVWFMKKTGMRVTSEGVTLRFGFSL